MKAKKNLWCIVLAAGEGKRLQSLTIDKTGKAVPKQFCSVINNQSMLRNTLDRVEKIISRDRIVIIVAAQHREWWSQELSDWPVENIVVQPHNRGTAVGILLPLLNILERDLEAKIMIAPSDHHVENEVILNQSCLKAVKTLEEIPHRLILLGITPDTDDTEYGWIVPVLQKSGASSRVSYFIEKPNPVEAVELLEQGSLWNSFILVGYGNAIMHLYAEYHPELLDFFLTELNNHPEDWHFSELEALYDKLPTLDFSRDLLEKGVDSLCVLSVPACGWSDLGTPSRIARCLAKSDQERLIQMPFRQDGHVLH